MYSGSTYSHLLREARQSCLSMPSRSGRTQRAPYGRWNDRWIPSLDQRRVVRLTHELQQIFEVEAMARVGKFLPPTSLVKVPKIHHYDVHNNFFIMEDCGTDVVTLREFLSSTSPSVGLAKTIGTAVGEFIASIHEWSRGNPEGILDTFDKNMHTKKLLSDLAYDRVLSTLQRSDKDDLPFLSDFELDAANIQAISKLTDEYRSRLMSPRVPGHDVVNSLKSE